MVNSWNGMALVARGEERYINEGHITGGLPIVSQTSEGVQYHQHDHLGTTVASYSQDGAIISAYETTVFGQGELEDSRTARFTGKPYDADLGAYVFPFRNYDPESARWLSADPSGFPDGPNQHYYAAVPTMGVDPLGLKLLDYPPVLGATQWNSAGTSDGWWNIVYTDYRYRVNPLSWTEPGITHISSKGKDLNHTKTVAIGQIEELDVGASASYGGITLSVGASLTTSGDISSDVDLEWDAIAGKYITGSVLVAYVQVEVKKRTRLPGNILDNPWSSWSTPWVEGEGNFVTMTAATYTEQ
jgi:RHS repeat-associated protein